MRYIRVHPADLELFRGTLETDLDYFNSHLSDFKKMWKEQGQTFWVRFLLSYRDYFEANMDTRCTGFTYLFKNEGERALSFFYIFIHKQFIERSADRAARFVKDASLAWNFINTLPSGSMEKADPSMCNVELFKSLLGNPSYFNELPNELIAYSVSCFSDFSVVVCNLLKKWIDETDMCESTVRKIDSSLVYWKPDCELKKPTSHDCFQKYLSDHWKNDLPKMILVRDAHNLFSFPGSCCSEVKSSNIFDILKDEMQSEANLMRQIDVISPDLVKCKLHANCLLLIAHKENCPEPYLCDGENQMCELECEVTLKARKKSCDSSKLIGTMAFEVQDTSKGLRTVSTQIGDKNEVIATLYNGREKSPCEAFGQCDYLSLQENLCAQADYEMRNCYRQRNKKIQLKMRLRSKLDKKQLSQLEHYFDQDAAVKLYERAISAWKMDFCKENYQNLGNMKGLKPCKALLYGKNFEQFKKLMLSVVVSTSDAVFGRVVVPSTREQKVLNPTKNVKPDLLLPFSIETKETTSGAKKSKKKKRKKPNSNNSNPSEEQSSTSKPETVHNIEPNENKTEITSASTDAEGNTTKDSLSSGVSPQDSSKSAKVVKKKSDEVPISPCPKKELVSETSEILSLANLKLDEIAKSAGAKENLDLSKKESELSGDQKVKELNSERPLTVKEEETVGKFFELIGIDPNQEKVDNQNDAVSSKVSDKKPQRVCANCNVKEVEYKSFKRCSRCKVENFPVHHYYCSRSCQIEDWQKCHREEHSKKNVTG